VQLRLSNTLLSLDLKLLAAILDLGLVRLAQRLATLFIFLTILNLHLLEFCALMLQPLCQFVLNLEHSGLFLLLKSALIMINVCAHLLGELLHAAISIFLRVLLHLRDISL